MLALPQDARMVCCDVSEEFTRTARRYWAEAGVADRIDLQLRPAIQTLDSLIAAGAAGSFDFAFIDADKENYDGYYERALVLLRPGGLVAVDNVLWSGAVADPEDKNATTEAIRRLNRKILRDKRVAISLVPIGDGLTLARKLP
jgi:predicted O-methyltransferase YrrM